MTTIVKFFSVLCAVMFLSAPAHAIFSGNGRAARLEFEGRILLHRTDTPADPVVRREITAQLKYFIGNFVSTYSYAAYLPDIQFPRIRFERKSAADLLVHYTASMNVVMDAGFLNGIPFYLPLNPQDAFAKNRTAEKTNLCTDKHGKTVSFGGYWYHWNPKAFYCPLQEGTDYFKVSPRIFPEPLEPDRPAGVEKLVKPDGTIEMTLFFGIGEDESPLNDDPSAFDPFTESGIKHSRGHYRDIRNYLLKMGLQEGPPWNEPEFQEYTGFSSGDSHFYVQEFRSTRGRIPILVRLFYGQTARTFNSRAFHVMLRKALMTSSYIGYHGHSGMGANLNLPEIARAEKIDFQMNPAFHQWVYFDSCMSFYYFHSMLKTLKPEKITIWSNVSESFPFQWVNRDFEPIFEAIWKWNTTGLSTPMSVLAADRSGLYRLMGARTLLMVENKD